MPLKQKNVSQMILILLTVLIFGVCNHSVIGQLLVTPTEELLTLSESLKASDITKIRELIKNGADVNFKNTYGVTPLWQASGKGHIEVVKLLLDNKADVNTARKADGVTPLFMASQEGHTDIVKLLLAGRQRSMSPAKQMVRRRCGWHLWKAIPKSSRLC